MVLLVIILIAMFLGCATTGKSISQMSPQEKATWMMSVYNAQYEDYKAVASMADTLTPEAKDILRAKKDILESVWPMIKMYNGYIDTGAIPDKELEDAIINQLNRLLQS